MTVRKASFALCVALISSLLYLVLHYISNSINNAVRKPYMDEIFHVPQAQRYCRANFTNYDPKITTPPGLYLLSYLRLWLRDKVLLRKNEIVCDTIDLRKTNHLVAISNFITLNLIQLTSSNRITGTQLSRKFGFKQRIMLNMSYFTKHDLAKIILSSLAITLLPPLFFFNSLYYTDAGSLLFTLLAYLFSINDQHVISACFGLISILFRQTNIVWLFYAACLVIIKTFTEHRHHIENGNSINGSNLSYKDILFDKNLMKNLVRRGFPYAIVGCAFVTFVILNKGIVLGDKDAHQPKLHLAQVLYFLGFCFIFGTSWIFSPKLIRRFLYFMIRSPLLTIITSSLIVYLIAFGRYAHPYLLADNRHVTFYIWRRILDRHNSYVPYLLTPVYLSTCLSLWYHLKGEGCKQMMLLLLCILLVIVPNGLLEPRYFIIPFVFIRLCAEASLFETILEIAQNLTIIISMNYLFLHKTFQWTDSAEVQRIMW